MDTYTTLPGGRSRSAVKTRCTVASASGPSTRSLANDERSKSATPSRAARCSLGDRGEPVLAAEGVLVLRPLARRRVPVGALPAGRLAEDGAGGGEAVVQRHAPQAPAVPGCSNGQCMAYSPPSDSRVRSKR